VDFYINLLANFSLTGIFYDGKKMNAFLTLIIFGMVRKIIIPKVDSQLVILTVVVSDDVNTLAIELIPGM